MNIGLIGGSELYINELKKQNIKEGIKIFSVDAYSTKKEYDILILIEDMKINLIDLTCEYLLINSDLNTELINSYKKNINTKNIISFGSSSKCTVTFSSIESFEKAIYLVCIQRQFFDINQEDIFPQEFEVQCFNKSFNSNYILLISTIMLIINGKVKNIV